EWRNWSRPLRTLRRRSRRLRALSLAQAWQPAAAAFRTQHLLCLPIVGFVGLVLRNHSRKLLTLHDLGHLCAVQHLALEQQLGHGDQGFPMLFDDPLRPVIAAFDQTLDLLVDADRGGFTVVAVLRDLAPEEDLLFLLTQANGTKLAHAPLADHLAS